MEKLISYLNQRLMMKIFLLPAVVLLIFTAASPFLHIRHPMGTVGAVVIVIGVSFVITIWKYVILPIRKLTGDTGDIANGNYAAPDSFLQADEIGRLSSAINRMGREIHNKTIELNEKKNEYQDLFELVPCIITVQDRDFKLVGFNQVFSNTFDPKHGDYCYSAYKGRSEKCRNCPVERTFQDGHAHYSEETGIARDGTRTHWIVKTAPVKNARGEITAAMEMSVDITPIKRLEDELKRSEKKYYAIFNTIPNPVFILDKESLDILDCNQSIMEVYGYEIDEILNRSFLELFEKEEREGISEKIKTANELNKVKQVKKNREFLYVNMRISPSDFSGKKVLLVTTSDVTKWLEAQSQLIQAGKMATLGEMATGVAHELNQPLSVIKTASDFIMRKLRKNEVIQKDILLTMAEEMDSHVDRASGIINHLRQFGRKADLKLEHVQVNDILKRAFEIFSQQFKLREIEVVWHLDEALPFILAEPGRLEQVFVNLLINARDAIDEKWTTVSKGHGGKRIILKSSVHADMVVVRVIDTGIGISDVIAGKIFDPFFTTKKVGDGTGIGLSISYGIIKDFGGSLGVDPHDPEGTCFTVTLPVMEETE